MASRVCHRCYSELPAGSGPVWGSDGFPYCGEVCREEAALPPLARSFRCLDCGTPTCQAEEFWCPQCEAAGDSVRLAELVAEQTLPGWDHV